MISICSPSHSFLKPHAQVAWSLCGQRHVLSLGTISALADVLLEMGKIPEAEHLFRCGRVRARCRGER